MAKPENLPPGFERLPSGSLRVRIRLTNRKPVVENFPLHARTAEARRRQMVDAEAWAKETRRKLVADVHVDTDDAKGLTVGDILKTYRDEGLAGKPSNVKKDVNRINAILKDDIAAEPVLRLRTTTLARWRDELIGRALGKNGKTPARTTLGNKLQLISRALSHARQTIDGIPMVEMPSLPESSAGRERRVNDEELAKMLEAGRSLDPILPLIIRFAISTALRKARVLEFQLSFVKRIGRGAEAISFPKSGLRAKKVGTIPVTAELREIITEAVKARNSASPTEALFAIDEYRFDYLWRSMLKDAEIEDLHFHDLRHEATSRLFEAGLTTAEVMSITGHTTKEMVDRYSHYSAALVLKKLERGGDPRVLGHELELLIAAFLQAGGKREAIAEMAGIEMVLAA
ncbi:site-specific integrase [Bosea sp. (in: a-proteobacteria)]|uniref:site-specific integrase n=1 Tax=Bosea sp. (in: a-proteobacteria) TaxID=1871050 RepID=UPI003F6F4405